MFTSRTGFYTCLNSQAVNSNHLLPGIELAAARKVVLGKGYRELIKVILSSIRHAEVSHIA